MPITSKTILAERHITTTLHNSRYSSAHHHPHPASFHHHDSRYSNRQQQ